MHAPDYAPHRRLPARIFEDRTGRVPSLFKMPEKQLGRKVIFRPKKVLTPMSLIDYYLSAAKT